MTALQTGYFFRLDSLLTSDFVLRYCLPLTSYHHLLQRGIQTTFNGSNRSKECLFDHNRCKWAFYFNFICSLISRRHFINSHCTAGLRLLLSNRLAREDWCNSRDFGQLLRKSTDNELVFVLWALHYHMLFGYRYRMSWWRGNGHNGIILDTLILQRINWLLLFQQRFLGPGRPFDCPTWLWLLLWRSSLWWFVLHLFSLKELLFGSITCGIYQWRRFLLLHLLLLRCFLFFLLALSAIINWLDFRLPVFNFQSFDVFGRQLLLLIICCWMFLIKSLFHDVGSKFSGRGRLTERVCTFLGWGQASQFRW